MYLFRPQEEIKESAVSSSIRNNSRYGGNISNNNRYEEKFDVAEQFNDYSSAVIVNSQNNQNNQNS